MIRATRQGGTMAALSTGTEQSIHQAGRHGWWTILLLSALYVMSLLDRTILSLLIGPIKAQFSLDDVQIGLLLGTAFGLVYSVLALPAARIADLGNRRLLVFAGVTIWCLSTMASAFAA